jgi:hypothetical protein
MVVAMMIKNKQQQLQLLCEHHEYWGKRGPKYLKPGCFSQEGFL